MGRKGVQLSLDNILEAIKDTGGIKTEVCKRLQCSRKTVYNYINKYPEVAEAFEEEEDKVLDMAESSLFALIQNGDTAAIFYYLNNKGKKRGYGSYKKNDDMLPDNDKAEQPVSGVLVTPGLLTEEEWEKSTT